GGGAVLARRLDQRALLLDLLRGERRLLRRLPHPLPMITHGFFGAGDVVDELAVVLGELLQEAAAQRELFVTFGAEERAGGAAFASDVERAHARFESTLRVAEGALVHARLRLQIRELAAQIVETFFRGVALLGQTRERLVELADTFDEGALLIVEILD